MGLFSNFNPKAFDANNPIHPDWVKNASADQIDNPDWLNTGGAPAMTAPKPKRDTVGTIADIVGTLSDGILSAYGQQGAYGKIQDQRRQFTQQQKLALAKAMIDRQNAQSKIDYERANPTPDNFERAMDAAGIPQGSPQRQQLAMQRANSLANPPQFVSDGMGGGRWAYPSIGMAAPSAPQPSHDLPQGYAIRQGGSGGNVGGGFR